MADQVRPRSTFPTHSPPPFEKKKGNNRSVSKTIQSFRAVLGLPSSKATFGMTHIASGAIKKVYKDPQNSAQVVQVAKGSLLAHKEQKLRQEAETKKAIAKELDNNTPNLDVTILQEDLSTGRLRLTVTSYDAPNLERRVNDGQSFTFPERIAAATQILRGLSTLHKAGYAHGDFKLDNCLTRHDVTQPESVVVGDLDKAKKTVNNQGVQIDAPYRGNTRYCAPENKTSQKADVYAAGIALIRILEGSCLTKWNETILTPEGSKPVKPIDDRRGLERFILQDARFKRTFDRKSSFPLGMALNLKTRFMSPKQSDLIAENKALNDYIDKLCENLVLNPSQKAGLNNLLKSMVALNPEDRPTTEESLARFEALTSKEAFFLPP